jgi:hypothetical protein
VELGVRNFVPTDNKHTYALCGGSDTSEIQVSLYAEILRYCVIYNLVCGEPRSSCFDHYVSVRPDKLSVVFRYYLPKFSDISDLVICKHRELFTFQPGIYCHVQV